MKIFISYSSKDRVIIQSLVHDLERIGHEVWFDQNQIRGGDAWWNGILDGIRTCDVFVFALSSNSLSSYPCKLEYTYAFDLHKPILPVLVSPIRTTLLPPPLAATQFVDYINSNRDSAFSLVSSLNSLPPSGDLPDPLPPDPPIPVSHLSILNERVTSPSLDLEQQKIILSDLRILLNESTEAREDVRSVVEQFARRTDLYHIVAQELADVRRASTRITTPALPRKLQIPFGLIVVVLVMGLLGLGAIAFRSLSNNSNPTQPPGSPATSIPTQVALKTPDASEPPLKTLSPLITPSPAKSSTVSPTQTPVANTSPIKIRIFVGVGTGVEPDQQAKQNSIAQEWNNKK